MTAQTESKEKKVGLDFLDDATLRRIAKDDIDPDFYEEDGDKVPSEEAHFAIVLLAKRSCGLEGLTDEDLAQIVNGYPHTEQGELTPGARLAFAELLRRSGRGASGSWSYPHRLDLEKPDSPTEPHPVDSVPAEETVAVA